MKPGYVKKGKVSVLHPYPTPILHGYGRIRILGVSKFFLFLFFKIQDMAGIRLRYDFLTLDTTSIRLQYGSDMTTTFNPFFMIFKHRSFIISQNPFASLLLHAYEAQTHFLFFSTLRDNWKQSCKVILFRVDVVLLPRWWFCKPSSTAPSSRWRVFLQQLSSLVVL